MTTPARILATALTTAVVVLVSALPSWADTPVTWAEEEGRSTLETIIFFGGWTGGLFVAVVLFALLTARKNYVPPAPENLPAPADH